MKTKEGEKQVLGFRCQGAAKKSEVRCPASDVRKQSCLPYSARPFCLLTPVSGLLPFKYEGDSGDMYENKGGGKTGVTYQVPGGSKKVRGPMSGVRNHEI